MKTTSTKRRVMAGFLSLCMIVSMLSVVAQAAGPVIILPGVMGPPEEQAVGAQWTTDVTQETTDVADGPVTLLPQVGGPEIEAPQPAGEAQAPNVLLPEGDEPVAGSNFTAGQLAKLRAGELTMAEVEEMIAQGLTEADLMDPYAIAPMALVDPGKPMTDFVDRFNFLVHVPRDTPKSYANYDALGGTYTYLKDITWPGPFTGAQVETVDNKGEVATDPVTYIRRYYPLLNGGATGVAYNVTRLSYHYTTVYRIGYLVITTTNAETGKKEDHTHLYASPEVGSSATSHFVLPSNAKITVEYTPVEYNVDYQVYVDGVSSATQADGSKPEGYNADLNLYEIYGASRPKTTSNQHISTPVTIPEGYIARVYIGSVDDAAKLPTWLVNGTAYVNYDKASGTGTPYDGRNNTYEKFPLLGAEHATDNYGDYPLGITPVYTVNEKGETVIDPSRGPAYFSRKGTYLSGQVGSASKDLVVRVVLEKHDYTLDDTAWMKTVTGSSEFQPGTKFDEFVWKLSTSPVLGNNSNIPELRTLEINGDPVQIPVVSTPGRGQTASESGETDLGYAKVEITLTAERDDNGTGYVTRTYEFTFTKVSRDLVITSGSFGNVNAPATRVNSLVVSELVGVELQVWSFEDKRPATNVRDWNDIGQGYFLWTDGSSLNPSLTGGLHFDWDTYPSYLYPPEGGNYNNSTTDRRYNARFRLKDGYAWGTGGAAAGITLTKGDGTPGNSITVADPIGDGWYYVKLVNQYGNNNTNSSNLLSIVAEPKKYQVNYLDGVNRGTGLQGGTKGLPTAGNIDGMPNFKSWNGLDESLSYVDNNHKNYYDMDNHGAISVAANVPTDKNATRPAVFQFWVLTNAQGEPIDTEGEPITDYDKTNGSKAMEKLVARKGDYTVSLSADVPYAFRQGDTNIYDIYLTAYWEPAADEFVYYITYNKIDENGAPQQDIYKPDGNIYPFTDATGATRYAAVDRNAHTKLKEDETTTVIVDIDSDLSKSAREDAGQWYKFDEFNQYSLTQKEPYQDPGDGTKHSHIYVIKNKGEADVWLYYTLGGLTVKHVADGADSGAEFTYEITFTLPEDDEGTLGDESKFFDSTEGRKVAAQLTDIVSNGRTHTGTFTLTGAADSLTFADLPAGTTYTVKQLSGTGYVMTKAEEGAAVARGTAVPPAKIDNGKGYTINALYNNTLTLTSSKVDVTLTKESAAYTGEDQGTDFQDYVEVKVNSSNTGLSLTKVTAKAETGDGKVINVGEYTVNISVEGTYNGIGFTAEGTGTFNVTQAETPKAEWFTFDNTSETYNAQPHTAQVRFANSTITNPDGDNLSDVTYYLVGNPQTAIDGEPINVGEYIVAVTVPEGKNMKGGTVQLTTHFIIEKADIANAFVRLNPNGWAFDEQAHYPGVALYMFGNMVDPIMEIEEENPAFDGGDGKTVTVEVDHKNGGGKDVFTVTYGEGYDGKTDYTQPDTYTVTVKAVSGNYEGETSRPFTIADVAAGGKDINEVVASATAASQIYNGQAWWKRGVKNADEIGSLVTFNYKAGAPAEGLAYGTDYTISFARSEVKNADTYSIIITGIGKYYGTLNDPVEFKILPADITGAKVTVASVDYDGTDHASRIASYVTKVTLAGFGDLDVNDLTVSIQGNAATNAGSYTVTIAGKNNDGLTGTGNFKGTVTQEKAFTINKATPDKDWFVYTRPDNLIYSYNVAKTAEVDLDAKYTGGGTVGVSYSSDDGKTWVQDAPVNVGNYKVGVTTTGGTNLNAVTNLEVGQFTIDPAPILNPTVTFNEELTYDGTAKTPTNFTLTYGSDTLTRNKDYELGTYGDNIDAGTGGYVTIRAKQGGNYSFGDYKAHFTIAQKELTLTWTFDDGTENGSKLTYDGTMKGVTVALRGVVSRDAEKVSVSVVNGKNIIPDTYTAQATVTDASGNYVLPTGDAATRKYTIGKGTPTVGMFTFTAPADKNYNGQPKAATVDFKGPDDDHPHGFSNPGGTITVKYQKDGDNTWTPSAPTAVGTYKVSIDIDSKGRHLNDVSGLTNSSWTLTIAKATLTVTEPEPTKGLTYNGNARALLVKMGSTSGGTLKYAVVTTNVAPDPSAYSTNIPTGTNAGTYYVWYTVEDAENYGTSNVTLPGCVVVTIDPADISTAAVGLKDDETGAAYDGMAHKPEVASVTLNGLPLGLGIDYKVTYDGVSEGDEGTWQGWTDPGTYYITITGMGNYGGTTRVPFTIASYLLDSASIKVDAVTAATYDGQPWNKQEEDKTSANYGLWRAEKRIAEHLTVTYVKGGNETPLTYNEDYYILFLDPTSAGDQTVTKVVEGGYPFRIVGMGDYAGSVDEVMVGGVPTPLIFKITPFKLELGQGDESGDPGEEPTITAAVTGLLADMTLTYSDEINWYQWVTEGIRVTVTYKPDPNQEAITFTMEPQKDFAVKIYRKTAQSAEEQLARASLIDDLLAEGYEEVTQVTDPGEYLVVLTAVEGSNFSGTMSFPLTVSPDLSQVKATLTVTPTSVTYNGKVQKPDVKVTIPTGTDEKGDPIFEELDPETDYEVDWDDANQNFTDVGTYTITVNGKGVYKGVLTATFTIQAVSSSGGGSFTPPPAPPAPEPILNAYKHGSVTLTPAAPKKGEKTTIQTKPEQGYKVKSVVVTDSEGKELNVTDNGDGTFSFDYPDAGAVVDVIFACAQTELCPVAAFNDVNPYAWYHDGLHYCLENGLMIGTAKDIFAPSAPATRAMVVTVLWRLEGCPAVAGAGEDFEDVPSDAWYAQSIAWAASEGIVLGVGDGCFCPDIAIAREEMATVFYRYSTYKGYDVTGQGSLAPFSDAGDISKWAKTPIAWAVDAGLIVGADEGSDTLLYPIQGATRLDMAIFLSRFCPNIGGME